MAVVAKTGLNWFAGDLPEKDQFRANSLIFHVAGTNNREPVKKPDGFALVLGDPSSRGNKPIT